MPQVIEHIDKIAREKKRDVLYVSFDEEEFSSYDYDEYEIRDKIIRWLKRNDIGYEECAHYASENYWQSYRGQLYLDVPMTKTNEDYRKIIDYFENEDGSMKLKGVTLFYLPLEIAMKNSYQDEPGFWDKWAENF